MEEVGKIVKDVRELVGQTVFMAQVYTEASDILDRIKLCIFLKDAAVENLLMAEELISILDKRCAAQTKYLSTHRKQAEGAINKISTEIHFDMGCGEILKKIQGLHRDIVKKYDGLLLHKQADRQCREIFGRHQNRYHERWEKAHCFEQQDILDLHDILYGD